MSSGIIFDIKHYSINDGPGIRTTVFFKGCPLHCAWCHNPESISPLPQKMYNEKKCIGCKECVKACPEEACILTPAGIVTDVDMCTSCGKCADVCPTLATEMSGRRAEVEDILFVVEKDRPFYEESGGGVTFSGGEPTRQPKFLLALLKECGARRLHRAVDTCGLVKQETMLAVAEECDHFLFDLKCMDTDTHRLWTGSGNELIHENLRALARRDAVISIRIPLITGINADEKNIEESARFLASLEGQKVVVNLLPYHDIAVNKYKRLGTEYDSSQMMAPTEERVKQIIEQFAEVGLVAGVGG
ncbi:glycyl-radical enzyme activating protein [Desulforhopalus vacuolatus]|uniref:glycyl-radical enzyme activating protein n=1 Tax=Desulforhopalus vacuolatus TaxID=40414 RepID=UPI001965F15A|nr:glycyl-radical enzyme activating protein [Desulforhopalus vacuolatus]